MRAILALGCLAAAACTTSSSGSPDAAEPGDTGLTCPSGVAPCGGACCTSDQECVQDTCRPRCATQIRCGAALELCCAADEECKDGACAKKCIPDCQMPDGSGPKQCGDDGCGNPCPPGCGAGEECTAQFACELPLHTGNDSCTSARELQFTGGVAREHGDTTGAQADAWITCASNYGGLDVVYSFTLATAQKVTASVIADVGSAILPVLSLRADPCTTNSDLLCAAPPAEAGGATELEAAKLSAGRYFLWIAGNVVGADGAGRFVLTVTLAEPDAPPANDTCANATLLDLSTGHAVIHGNLASANGEDTSNTPNTSCWTVQATPGPDVVYKFQASGTQGFSARLAFDNPTSTAMAGLYLRTGCEFGATEVGCPQDNQRFAAMQVATLPMGTYYLFVDTSSLAGEPFTLSVDLGAPPVNDSCTTGAQAITLDAAGKATLSGDTSLANNDTMGGGLCSGQANDVVYKLHLDGDKSVALTVTPTGINFLPVVYVRSTCAGSDSLACGYATGAQPVALEMNRLTRGDWFIWVAGYYAPYWGSFTLSVSAADVTVPANDLCAAAIPLTLDAATKKVSVTGSTTYGWDDYQGTTCGTGYPTMDGPDLVYKVTLAEAASLTVAVSRDPNGSATNALSPAVYLRTTCASTAAADEQACARADYSNPGSVTAVLPSAEATTYYIIVDGTTGSAGDFELDVTARRVVTNDTCSNPTDIPIDAATGIGSVSGDDTSFARDDDYGSCQSQYATGPDLVYQFTLSQDRAVTIDLTPDASAPNYKPVFFVRRTCDLRASQLLNGCVASATGGAAAQLSFNALAQGTYFVWVDGNTTGAAATSGAFTLTVTTSAPPAAPAGDTCATAIPLILTATTADPTVSQGTATGDTTNARDNALGLGLCEGSAAGDLVYSVTLAQAQKLTAVVTPDAASTTYRPAVYIRRNACASGADADQVADAIATSPGQSVSATANSLPLGTYWIWVDSISTTGSFTLEVTATTPVAGPANDNCSAPEALTFTGTTATVTGTTVDAQNDSGVGSPYGYGIQGGDVVYSFTATNADPRNLTASVTAGAGAPAGFLPVVTIRDRCGSLADPLAVAQAYSSTQPATTWPISGVTAGTYYVWVDTGNQGAIPATPGPFTLTVTLEVPNDQCAGAENIMANTPLTGDTTHAVDQYGTSGGFSARCTTALGTTTQTPGPEVVYVYYATRSFTVTVTPAAGFDAVVWVTAPATSTQCGEAGTCVAAANAAGAGGVETVSVTVTTGAQYFIQVDSAQASAVGSFTIQVQ